MEFRQQAAWYWPTNDREFDQLAVVVFLGERCRSASIALGLPQVLRSAAAERPCLEPQASAVCVPCNEAEFTEKDKEAAAHAYRLPAQRTESSPSV
jgi:hypothetical protein